MAQPFHLAIPVADLKLMRDFYGKVLGCAEGRSSDHWVDFDFFEHQLVLHHKAGFKATRISNPVDGHNVPVPHFGAVLERSKWDDLADRLRSAGIKFVIEPYVRFEGQTGEQATMFFEDPEGNALEFKSFADMGQLFAK